MKEIKLEVMSTQVQEPKVYDEVVLAAGTRFEVKAVRCNDGQSRFEKAVIEEIIMLRNEIDKTGTCNGAVFNNNEDYHNGAFYQHAKDKAIMLKLLEIIESLRKSLLDAKDSGSFRYSERYEIKQTLTKTEQMLKELKGG